MLQEQSRFYQRLLFFADLCFVALGWILAYFIRFEALTPPEWLPLSGYLQFLPGVLLVSAVVFYLTGLYGPQRAQRFPLLVYSVAKAVAIGLLTVLASLFFYRTFSFSRLHMLLFAAVTPVLMISIRVLLYSYVRRARQRGHNVRRVLIAGAGESGRRLEAAFSNYPWMGFEVLGFLDDQNVRQPDVLGSIGEASSIVDRFEAEGRHVDYLYVALPLAATPRIAELVDAFATRFTHVCVVPDLVQLEFMNSRLTYIDGLPVIHLMDEAPLEYRRVLKRAVDVVFSVCFLAFAAPLMLAIAAAIKATSKGPVLYRQERMSLNGHRFQMLKFRSMPVDAEAATGPSWAEADGERATSVGRWLRRTSLDELPQFLNVLKGDMSVVGPRPERPVFIDEFRSRVPRYMLRHKVRAGITGWAQVNGWRGNTSLEKRIEHDLYYIQNWSLRLDFKIMAMTVWKGFVHENAY